MYALEAYNFEVHISISVYCWVSVLGGKEINPICVDRFTERWRAHVVYVQFFGSKQTLKRF